MKCQAVIDIVEKLAPKRLAEEWDNPGLLVGSPQQEIKKVMVCLDVSLEVVEYAIFQQADMLIAHHPMIFRGLKKIRTDLYDGRMLSLLLQHNMAVYAAHTNLDAAKGGVNDVLAAKIGLRDVVSFLPVENYPEESMGRIGMLPEPVTLKAFAQRVKKALNAEFVRVVQANDKMIQKVALCSGAGADFIGQAAFKGADVYLTGDVKYHDAQRAVQQNINLVDGGHFPTEFPVVEALAAYLRENMAKAKRPAEIITDTVSRDFFKVI